MNTNKPDRKLKPTIVLQTSLCPIYQFDLPEIDPDVVATNLKSLFEGRPHWNESNSRHKGFHVTQTEIFTKKTCHLFNDLLEAIEQKVLEIVEDSSNLYKEGLYVDIRPVVENYWGVMYQKGDKADWHNHEDMFCFQAVYYPMVEDDTPILFQSQTSGSIEIKPKKGSLVVFNGRTRHMVPEITSDKIRMSFASNLIYKRC